VSKDWVSNTALAIVEILDSKCALGMDDLRALARHLSDRIGECDAEVLGAMLAPDLLKAAEGIECMSRLDQPITARCAEMDALCVAIRNAKGAP